jgi:hypothetical protein
MPPSGQGFAIYVIKKGHARDIYFLLQTRNFWYFSAPSSLFTCCYLLARGLLWELEGALGYKVAWVVGGSNGPLIT